MTHEVDSSTTWLFKGLCYELEGKLLAATLCYACTPAKPARLFAVEWIDCVLDKPNNCWREDISSRIVHLIFLKEEEDKYTHFIWINSFCFEG